MPILNGDAMADTSVNALDFTKALEVLKNDYPERDGIDVKTLINSKENGGLTYNDFLVLPGYIGMSAHTSSLDHAPSNLCVFRLPCL
jgi:IMP dehydrogenase